MDNGQISYIFKLFFAVLAGYRIYRIFKYTFSTNGYACLSRISLR